MNGFLNDLKKAFSCLCPQCEKGALYRSTFDLRLNNQCNHCGLDLEKNDSADGPAVFLIFILGFLIVPLALLMDSLLSLSLLTHTIIWSIVILALTIGSIKPLKAYIIMLQYRHRKTDWDKND